MIISNRAKRYDCRQSILYLHYSHIRFLLCNAVISDIRMHADRDTIYTCVRYS